MKQEIIKQMRAELYDTNLCRNDFEKYDAPALESETEPFLWMVRKNGTSVIRLGASGIAKLFSTECARFCQFRDPKSPIASFLYYDTDPTAKLFYWDGYALQRIEFSDISEIFDNLTKSTWQQALEEHWEEYEMRNTPLEIRYTSEETEMRFKKTLEYAKSVNDKTLANIMIRLSSHARTALNHYILISTDFMPHSYNFAEIVNDKCCLNGGIIMHTSNEHIHWQTHT